MRQAGKTCGRRPLKESKTPTSRVSPAQTPKISRVKIKIGTGSAKKVTIITDTSASAAAPRSSSTSCNSSLKSTYVRYDDDDEEDDGNDYDEDYNPWKEDQTPKWNKSRSIFHRHKGRRRQKESPEREILIQSMPEPDIIIDRAEESPHVNESDVNKEEETVGRSEVKAPRMMLLPGEIKEETLDEDAEGEDKDDNNSNDIGTVHIHCSPLMKRVHTKPTARKSTMPRIALKKTR